MLNVASNDFCTLPGDLSFLKTLEEINLSSNTFSSDSVLVNPAKLFSSMATIPCLKKLNLSRNKFRAFHAEEFPPDNLSLEPADQVFPCLEELNFAFNTVESEEALGYCVTQLPRMAVLIVTGNPFAIRGDPMDTQSLEAALQARGGRLINEALQPPTYLRRQKSRRVDGKPPLMLNYNFPQSREMVVVNDALAKQSQMHQEKLDLFPMPDQDVVQALEYH